MKVYDIKYQVNISHGKLNMIEDPNQYASFSN